MTKMQSGELGNINAALKEPPNLFWQQWQRGAQLSLPEHGQERRDNLRENLKTEKMHQSFVHVAIARPLWIMAKPNA